MASTSIWFVNNASSPVGLLEMRWGLIKGAENLGSSLIGSHYNIPPGETREFPCEWVWYAFRGIKGGGFPIPGCDADNVYGNSTLTFDGNKITVSKGPPGAATSSPAAPAPTPIPKLPLWILGTDGNAYQRTGSGWDGMDGRGTRIAVGPNGQVFLLNANAGNTIWSRNGRSWNQIPGAALDIGVGDGGSIFVIGTDGKAYRWTGSGWSGIDGGSGTRIVVGPKSQVFLLNANANHSIWRHDGSTWTQIPGAALDIGVGAGGSIFVIGTDGKAYRWTGSGWTDVDGGSGTRIAVGPNDQPVLLNAKAGHSIWRHEGSTWIQIPGAALDIGICAA